MNPPPQPIEKEAREVLERPLPDHRGERAYTKPLRHLDARRVKGRPHVIFVAYYPDAHLLKKSLVLRERGVCFTSLLAGCIREDSGIADYFDQYYEYRDFNELHHLLRSSQPHAWHASAPMYHPALILYAGKGRARLAVDLPDPALFLHSDPNHPDIRLEKEILGCADAVVHKMPEPAWRLLEAHYGLACPGYDVMSLPHTRFAKDPGPKPTRSDTPHVVYAGGLIPYEIALSRGHGNHIFDGLIELTGPGRFELTLMVNRNAREMPWQQHRHYNELESSHSRFHFRKGAPYKDLSQTLCGFAAGILFDNLHLSSYSLEHYRYNVASKLFAYLESGLPVVVYEESEVMAQLVRKHHLGTTYEGRNPASIVEAVHAVQKEDFTDSIRDFCSHHTMENQAEKLFEAYGL